MRTFFPARTGSAQQGGSLFRTVRLSEAADGRDNNLNLLRMLAATAVLISHAWLVLGGAGTLEPLELATGHTLGRHAVYVFFVISGFLITASFQRSRSAGRFVLARALRLIPGLVVSVTLVAYVLGPLVTDLPVAAYLRDREVFRFVWHNSMLVWPQYTLPGVFTSNPYPRVESAIWTLVHEVACYALVFGAGIAGLLRGRKAYILVALCLLGWGVLTLWPVYGPGPVHRRIHIQAVLTLPFVIGMAGWLWRDRILLSIWGVAGLFVLAWACHGGPAAYPTLILFIAYATAWLAYVPAGPLRAYNRFGDYSYGVYIYAFPLQALTVWLFGQTGPLVHILIALPPTLLCAVLSWHFVEEPALSLLRRGRRTPLVTPPQRPPAG